MSLQYRSSDGTETTVAGLAPAGQLVPSVALKQTNTITISSGTTIGTVGLYLDVYLATPMPDTDYNVLLQIDTMYPEDTIAFSVGEAEKLTNRYRLYPICDTVKTLEHDIILIGTAVKFMTDEVHEADSAHIAQNTANFAPAFSDVTSYAVGDYVTYNNILYRCTTAHTAGTWVAGHFTQVTVGGTLGEIVPSNATSSNKLVPVSDTIINYTPATSYNSWDEFLEMLHQKGTGMWCGKAYLGTQWWSYYVSIQVGNAGYWLGNGIFKGSDSTQLIGVNKSYSTGTTWTITEYNRAPYAFNSDTAHIVATLPNNSLYRVTVDKHMQNTEMGVFLIGIYGTTSITLLKEAESTAGKFTISHTAANTVEITDTDGGHIWAKFEYLGGYS